MRNMEELDFDIAFDNFLHWDEYDEAEGALYHLVKAAFRAGWLAAGGPAVAEPPPVIQFAPWVRE